jgi:hypothetical protein
VITRDAGNTLKKRKPASGKRASIALRRREPSPIHKRKSSLARRAGK